MGNGLAKLTPCCSSAVPRRRRRRHVFAAVTSEPFDETLGHSFCYVPEDSSVYRSISGAALSANASTPPSTSDALALASHLTWPSSAATTAAFESSTSFSSGPLNLDRPFLSGPIDRSAFHSGPLPRSLSLRPRRTAASLLKSLSRSLSSKPSTKFDSFGSSLTSDLSDSSDPQDGSSRNLQWAQGKAGEDRVHVVISDEHGWVFVGIYDGFSGPDATDYLLANLYSSVQRELKGLLWDEDKPETRHLSDDSHRLKPKTSEDPRREGIRMWDKRRSWKTPGRRWEENQRKWKCEWDRERLELDRRLEEQLRKSSSLSSVNHHEVLKALSMALKKTEDAYLDIADKMLVENPELALMGSCVLVMLMKGEDVYLMNVGDSRAILARKAEPDVWGSIGKPTQDLERIKEEMDCDDLVDSLPSLVARQLTLEHSTSVEEEVRRIKNEHPDDTCAIVNDRVKGSLKVTRAFGAGFLKQPKWNNALLEMFRIDYVGSSPYITCKPFVCHHRLGPKDRFLILSSDGLYQYFTNEEAIAQVEQFLANSPEGDPAQHLVEEVLFRAAEKAGMDFHELLEIPQGDRRRYHDDVSIIIISLEGRIWRSCM
ncbi:Protein-serine/threonine phosphatase protein [Dioscorea alata]|uniref:Protein-serine/threonine phosphatase protein n=1 Tax=Dioscorea alata TaxID=55571 RepID=A0ACB7V3U8_DIOAL|nr:Protein-serine/threonine phosphatase protein [Dioscorea alata]